jgi:hypothetical protein
MTMQAASVPAELLLLLLVSFKIILFIKWLPVLLYHGIAFANCMLKQTYFKSATCADSSRRDQPL